MKTSKREWISFETKDRLLLYGLPIMMVASLIVMICYLVFVPDDPEHTWLAYLFGAGLGQLLRKLHQAMRGDLH
ncbi:MAG: hypothetical protein A3J10_01255 [Candidatus Sungbacteria bacterium RIFCSPLOWO2_02_FULL_54_10]|uniref:Uncharacterized protein n=1 Tax=Candidatus Sungbacteria bacterium RIFCSPHIGHO2_02_FULL_53_17 TaxID=1802275 RepID=A0A1G2L0K6_9BACT|nr:MAG: hypothetical protein A2679_00770 [Candidatus Sungbacteria bacterium RIFCSPHIGHO2_01_FULL_54_26]OHA04209.1 MAG: hypothetical protein A3C92_00440 [Candidatus Sungbacteria bacterium RIFCSPHIGHO2_02_FULL_53_17]OHA13749.1 MAG: hypothetical protein A3J10_01255 [Candidatus Sungbacteria bacterium RIFCSPLOWO2_02_FULL_54_10]